MSDNAVAAVLCELESVRGWQEEFYRDLHAHPELSHHEHRTAALVASPDGTGGSLQIEQDARIYLANMDQATELTFDLAAGRHADPALRHLRIVSFR